MKRLTIAVALTLAAFSPAMARAIPKLNYQATCASTPSVGMDKKATVESCLNDERNALAALPPVWSKSTRKSRADCTTETSQGGLPSYVELLTCLQGYLLEKQ